MSIDEKVRFSVFKKRAKIQNTGPLIYILLNHNNAYCVMLCSSKGFDTYKTSDLKWPK